MIYWKKTQYNARDKWYRPINMDDIDISHKKFYNWIVFFFQSINDEFGFIMTYFIIYYGRKENNLLPYYLILQMQWINCGMFAGTKFVDNIKTLGSKMLTMEPKLWTLIV